jgi:hypothetical protein
MIEPARAQHKEGRRGLPSGLARDSQKIPENLFRFVLLHVPFVVLTRRIPTPPRLSIRPAPSSTARAFLVSAFR